MNKTLADMTPEDRAATVGMWCDVKGFTRPTPIVEMWGMEVELLVHNNIRGHITETYEFEHVTPCFDLPRAWTADGQPVAGEWEEGHVVVSYDEPDPGITKDPVSIEGLSEGGMSYYQEPPNDIVVQLDRFGEGEGKARRWVGEWEQDNE